MDPVLKDRPNRIKSPVKPPVPKITNKTSPKKQSLAQSELKDGPDRTKTPLKAPLPKTPIKNPKTSATFQTPKTLDGNPHWPLQTRASPSKSPNAT